MTKKSTWSQRSTCRYIQDLITLITGLCIEMKDSGAFFAKRKLGEKRLMYNKREELFLLFSWNLIFSLVFWIFSSFYIQEWFEFSLHFTFRSCLNFLFILHSEVVWIFSSFYIQKFVLVKFKSDISNKLGSYKKNKVTVSTYRLICLFLMFIRTICLLCCV